MGAAGKKLAANVWVGGQLFMAGSSPDKEFADQITNPRAWGDEPDPVEPVAIVSEPVAPAPEPGPEPVLAPEPPAPAKKAAAKKTAAKKAPAKKSAAKKSASSGS